MLGLPYYPNDNQLAQDRKIVQKRLLHYNQLMPTQNRRRKSYIKMIIPDVGDNCSIYPPFLCDYGYNIHIGNNFFANYGCIILDAVSVTIGNNVMLGPYTIITTASHPINTDVRNTGLICGKPIVIEDNVWIGANCVINPGSKVGRNTIIGSGSIITGDIPCNVIAVGNPCKVIRELTGEEE